MIFEDFVIKANKTHNSKYKYIKESDCIDSFTYIKIVCPIHGEFKQIAYAHLKGQGCPKCAGNHKFTTDEFIELAKQKNHNNISFEKTIYINKRTKVIATCHEKDEFGNEHGDYQTYPKNILNGCKCPKCAHKHNINKGREYVVKTKWSEETIRQKTEEFIQKCKDKHLEKNISFEETVYLGSMVKTKFICNKHGEFYMTPNNFLAGHKCPYCSKNKKLTAAEILKRLDTLYGDKYFYINITDSTKYDDKIEVYCKMHGIFKIRLSSLLNGYSCSMCAKNKKLTNNEFIERCKSVMPKNTIFDKTKYENYHTKVLFTCPKHGDFYKLPSLALKGSGCPECHTKSNIENQIENILTENKIKFVKQKEFDWLILKNKQYIDFYLENYNIAIEVQGEQHFQERAHFGGEKELKKVINRDINKFKKCNENGIKLIYYIPYKNINYEKVNNIEEIYSKNNVFNNITDLINYIKSQPKIKT